MKKSFKILMLAFATSFIMSGVQAQTGTYNQEDLADIRAFLRQPSAEQGKANFEQFGLTVSDTADWTSSTDWVWKLSATWVSVDGEQRLGGVLWIMKKLGGTFSLPHCEYLTSINVFNNGIEAVDVSGNPALTSLTLTNNPLAALDVTGNPVLKSLSVESTSLSALDVTGNPALTVLAAGSTGISNLDLSGNPMLEELYCSNCQELESIDFYNNLSLRVLNATSCGKLTELDLSGLTGLVRLFCSGCDLASLNLRANVNLEELQCQQNQISSLVFPSNSALRTIDCHENGLEALDGLENLPRLQSLQAQDNRLNYLDVSNNDSLVILYCNGNALEAVEGLANLAFLKDFRCQDNDISDLSMLPTERLQTFRAENNRLRISTLPVPLNAAGEAIYAWWFWPQQVWNGGAVEAGDVIDLSAEASKTFGGTTHATTYAWFELGPDMEERAVELTSTETGIFPVDASMTGKTLRCKMTNAFFNTNNGQVSDTAFPIVYEVYVAGEETYASDEVAALKAFLRQESAEEGRSNAEALSVDTSAWMEGDLWLWSVEGLRLSSGAEKRVESMDWSGKGLAGELELSGFAQLDSLDVSDNALTALALDDCPALQSVRCQDNALRFSTLPKVEVDVFEMASQADIDLGRVNYADGIDLRSENEVVLDGASTTTEYRWVVVTSEGETGTTALTNRDGLFIPDTSLCGKNLRVYLTNEAYWGETPASQLRLCANVFVNHYVEPTYSEEELAQLRAFLRQEGNFAELGLAVADTADWTENSTWVADVEGMEWAVFGNEYKVVEISWADKGLAGNLDLSGFDALEIVHVYDNDLVSLNLSGAEALTELRMNNNVRCATLNLQGCTALERMYVQNCALESLDVASCEALVFVQAFNNKLKAFDASGKAALTTLYLHDNELEEIDLTGCRSLASLNVSNNSLEALDVSSTSVTFLDCSRNRLTLASLPRISIPSFNYSPQSEVEGEPVPYQEGVDLSVFDRVEFPGQEPVQTSYAWFDVTAGTALQVDTLMENDGTGRFSIDKSLSGMDLRCEMTNAAYPGLTLVYSISLEESVSAYDAGELVDLRTFLRFSNEETGLTNAMTLGLLPSDTTTWNQSAKWLARLTRQGHLTWKYENEGTQEEKKRLVKIFIVIQKMTGNLDLSACTELEELDCTGIGITGLDVTKCLKLRNIWCMNNQIPVLDFSANTALVNVMCYNNPIKTLEFKNHPDLMVLDCQSCGLEHLDVSSCEVLRVLNCQNNKLKEVDVTGSPYLENLFVSYNQLTDLDITKNPDLMYFYAANNRISTYFDFARYNRGLWHIHIEHNQVEGFSVSDMTIEEIDVSYNELTFSTIPFDFTRKTYVFAPQDTVDLGSIPANGILDISSEYMLDTDGSHSYYEWQILSGSEWLETDDVITLDETGIFVFDKDAVGNRYRCLITSDNVYRCALTMEYYVDVVEASSNAEDDKIKVSVYPNPVADELHVTSSRTMETIRLFDMNGRLVYQSEAGSPEHRIDMENLPSGMYVLDVDGLLRKKVVKH